MLLTFALLTGECFSRILDNMDNKEFGKRLRIARIDAGYDQQKMVAEELGIERTRYLKYEHGDSMPPMNVLAQICELLNVSADYLLGLSDRPKLRQIKKPAELADLGVQQVQKASDGPLTPAEIAAIRAILALRQPPQG